MPGAVSNPLAEEAPWQTLSLLAPLRESALPQPVSTPSPSCAHTAHGTNFGQKFG